MRIPAVVLLGSFCAAALAAQALPQSPPDPPPPTFRVEVNYVEVDAVITDAQG